MFHDKHDLGIVVSWNQLKYVVTDNQVIHLRGTIRGHYLDKDTLVTPDFVHLQHTNGNNYLMINLVKRQNLLNWKNFQLSAIGKIGAGPLISYTFQPYWEAVYPGRFRYHGLVTGASAGLRLNIYKYFFIQTDLQGAFVNYTTTEMGADRQGRATHTFYSLQYMWAGGFNIPLSR